MHIDFNSYFASVEQQANPHLRGKPIGVTGGDKQSLRLPDGSLRIKRTVLGAASIEAKKFGVKTGMQIWEAKRLCPQIIIVPGNSDKYLTVTTKFINILKDYTPYLEVFSIDECFLQLVGGSSPIIIAQIIKRRIRDEIGKFIKCSVGISYNKLMAKLAGSLQKPDGLVVIENEKKAMEVLDKIPLDEICGIGFRIKRRLNNMGIFNFKSLRGVPLDILLLEFKSYGNFLYNASRGIDHTEVIPFFEKEEVKSISHRYTLECDTSDVEQIKQSLLKLTELIARNLRAKKLVGKTIYCWYRDSVIARSEATWQSGFTGNGMQSTIIYPQDGLEIFKAAWKIFWEIWNEREIRMIGISISNLKPITPQNLTLLPEGQKQEKIIQALDKINNKFGEFSLQRAILLNNSYQRRPQ